MRLHFRKKIGNFTVFALLSHTQTLEGMTSKVGPDEHIILWDLENCSLDESTGTLFINQYRYRLGDIFIVSDADRSFRGGCFSRRPFKEYLRILLDTNYLDYNFFFWTVVQGKATLRTSDKAGRPPQKVVARLRGYEKTEIPERVEYVLYDTGLQKKGMTIGLG